MGLSSRRAQSVTIISVELLRSMEVRTRSRKVYLLKLYSEFRADSGSNDELYSCSIDQVLLVRRAASHSERDSSTSWYLTGCFISSMSGRFWLRISFCGLTNIDSPIGSAMAQFFMVEANLAPDLKIY